MSDRNNNLVVYTGSPSTSSSLARAQNHHPMVPAVVVASGEATVRRFIEFFTATIRNGNTRTAYARAVSAFLEWCRVRSVHRLADIEPITVAAWVEELQQHRSAPTVKQHLAAVRMLFDWLVTGQVVRVNPAASVRGPKYVI